MGGVESVEAWHCTGARGPRKGEFRADSNRDENIILENKQN